MASKLKKHRFSLYALNIGNEMLTHELCIYVHSVRRQAVLFRCLQSTIADAYFLLLRLHFRTGFFFHCCVQISGALLNLLGGIVICTDIGVHLKKRLYSGFDTVSLELMPLIFEAEGTDASRRGIIATFIQKNYFRLRV